MVLIANRIAGFSKSANEKMTSKHKFENLTKLDLTNKTNYKQVSLLMLTN